MMMKHQNVKVQITGKGDQCSGLPKFYKQLKTQQGTNIHKKQHIQK